MSSYLAGFLPSLRHATEFRLTILRTKNLLSAQAKAEECREGVLCGFLLSWLIQILLNKGSFSLAVFDLPPSYLAGRDHNSELRRHDCVRLQKKRQEQEAQEEEEGEGEEESFCQVQEVPVNLMHLCPFNGTSCPTKPDIAGCPSSQHNEAGTRTH